MDERQFRHLLNKYIQGNCTRDEHHLLHRFYQSYQKVTEDFTFGPWPEEKKLYQKIQQGIERRHRQQYEAKRQAARRVRSMSKMAASWLLVVGLGVAVYLLYEHWPTPEKAWMEKSTQKGQKATIMLTDGTKVYLNVDSKLSFPEHFAANQREVILKGEAFFEVARNPKKPFIIATQNLTTTVVGTSFNIKAFEGESPQITVTSGQVKVNAADRNGLSQEVLLLPYQQASFNGQLTKQPVDIQPFVAWREKILQFNDVSLAEAATVLERWFDVSITIDAHLRSRTISGTYINETLTNVLGSFKHVLDITVHSEGERKFIITAKQQNL